VSFFPMRITTSAESLSEETGADKVLDDLKRQHLESFFAPASISRKVNLTFNFETLMLETVIVGWKPPGVIS
jgi:hypothetical protein